MNKIDELIKKYCPNGVKYIELKKISEIRSGWGFPNKEQGKKDGELPFYKVGDMNIEGNELFMNLANNYISYETSKRLKCNPAPEHTIIFPKIGAAIGTNKKRILTQESCYDNNVMGIIVDENIINYKYLFYVMEQIDLLDLAEFSGAIPSIRKSTIEEYAVAVPPMEVQCEIVHILDNFTLLSAELSAEMKARQKQYKYYLHNLLDIEDGKEMTIGDIYDFKYGTGNTIPEGGGEYPVYGSNGMVGYYSEYNSEDAPVIGHIGAYAGIVNWAKGKHFVTYNGVICKHKNIAVNKKYAYYILLTQDFIGEQKGAQPFVSYDALRKPIVKIPELEEQERIVNILDRFDRLCNDISDGLPAEIEARRKQYEYYRDKLLTFKELVNEG